jgi:8-oxo-dGTP pyrophosphatase MutT (NUDIX family)
MPISPYLSSLRDDVGSRLLLLPGVSAVVFDDEGRILLGERSDNGRWGLIAGVMDPGEQPAETVVREVYEETAVHVQPERIIGVFTQPPHTYPNGHRCEYVDIAFRCRLLGGEARVNDDESLSVAWFTLDALPPLDELTHHRIELSLTPSEAAWFATGATHLPAQLGRGPRERGIEGAC